MSFCQEKKVYKQYSNLYIVRGVSFSIIHKHDNILGNVKWTYQEIITNTHYNSFVSADVPDKGKQCLC